MDDIINEKLFKIFDKRFVRMLTEMGWELPCYNKSVFSEIKKDWHVLVCSLGLHLTSNLKGYLTKKVDYGCISDEFIRCIPDPATLRDSSGGVNYIVLGPDLVEKILVLRELP